MPRGKMVYISEAAHQQLKLLAARRNCPMGELVEKLVEGELADLLNPWTSPEGLILQQSLLVLGCESLRIEIIVPAKAGIQHNQWIPA